MAHPASGDRGPDRLAAPVDEHCGGDRRRRRTAWEALVGRCRGRSTPGGRPAGAPLLGCAHLEAQGEPSVIGSTLPGFIVSRSVRPSTLALLGQHRFSRYALVFYVDELGPGARGFAPRPEPSSRAPRARLSRARDRHPRPRPGGATDPRDRQAAGGPRRRHDRPRRGAALDRGTTSARGGRRAPSCSRTFSPRTPPTRPAPTRNRTSASTRSRRCGRRSGSAPRRSSRCSSEIVAIEGDTGVVRVEVRYGPPKNQEYRDLWIVRLDAEGRCTHFEEWPFWPPGTEGAPAAGADA